MLSDFFIPLLAVGLAELGDKTQLAVFCLSSKTKKYFQLLFGVILAFAIADGIAVIFGDLISNVIPRKYLMIAAGTIFIIFGIVTLLSKDEKEDKCELKKPFMSGFLIVLVAEMGDKTQLASALFAVKYNAWLVFFGVLIAMSILSIIAIFLSSIIFKKLDKKIISYIAGGLFILLGILSFFGI